MASSARLLALSLVALLVVTSAAAQQIRVRTPGDSDFSRYASYRWEERKVEGGEDNPLRQGGPMDLAIRTAVDDVLEGRGLERVSDPAADVDLVLAWEAAAFDQMQIDPGRQRVTDDLTVLLDGNTQQIKSYQQATLVLELTDSGTGRPVWIGSGQKKMKLAVDDPKTRKAAAALAKRIAQQYPQR